VHCRLHITFITLFLATHQRYLGLHDKQWPGSSLYSSYTSSAYLQQCLSLQYLQLTYNMVIKHDQNNTVLLVYLAFKSIDPLDQLVLFILH